MSYRGLTSGRNFGLPKVNCPHIVFAQIITKMRNASKLGKALCSLEMQFLSVNEHESLKKSWKFPCILHKFFSNVDFIYFHLKTI